MRSLIIRASVIIATCILGLTSCATERYIAKNEIGSIDEMVLITPSAEISYIDNKGQEALDDSLSATCSRLLTESVLRTGLPVRGLVENDGLLDEMIGLTGVIPKKAGLVVIPQEIDRMLEAKGCRYGIVLYANGFERDSKNYGKEVFKGVFMSILTMAVSLGTATAYFVPQKSLLNTWIAIFDSETDGIIYLNRLSGETSPCNASQVDRHIRRLCKPISK